MSIPNQLPECMDCYRLPTETLHPAAEAVRAMSKTDDQWYRRLACHYSVRFILLSHRPGDPPLYAVTGPEAAALRGMTRYDKLIEVGFNLKTGVEWERLYSGNMEQIELTAHRMVSIPPDDLLKLIQFLDQDCSQKFDHKLLVPVVLPESRARFLNTLRGLIERSGRMPVNKLGSPLVSDFDLMTATDHELYTAAIKADICKQ